ncbi:MAG: histidine phosphatase family protein [Muribaculaceae bacterium]|nr:histidine phosphatase family protein [Muribaculaceae bacterium]
MKRLLYLALLVLSTLAAGAQEFGDTITLTYKLHGQTRRFRTCYTERLSGAVVMDWSIVRNLRLWQGSYTMSPASVADGTSLSYLMPEDGNRVVLPDGTTFAMLSRCCHKTLAEGHAVTIDGVVWTPTAVTKEAIECVSSEGARMKVANSGALPLIVSMQNNPLEINWTASWHKRAVKPSPREEIAANTERSGGIYYAYPYTDDVMPEIPTGYSVSHISHYGRHGSRWVIREFEYGLFLDTIRGLALTPYGEDVVERVKLIADHARGHAGELTPLGERQHRGIAERMYRRFPHLFADSSRVWARSSMEQRCIMSMAAFSERLKELNPSLRVERHATPSDMHIISYSSPEAKRVNADSATWWKDLNAYRGEVVNPERLMSAMFVDSIGHDHGVYLSWLLHNIAVDVQDAEPGVELMDIFTPEEAYAHWLPLNYKMYYLHGNNPRTDAAGPHSAHALLDDIVTDMDSAIAGGAPAVTLRFGHDTALLRLLALMGLEGADAQEDEPDNYSEVWQDYRLAPMAANLQLILLTGDESHEPLILIRHNERPAKLSGLTPLPGGYYRWSDLKSLWTAR